MFLTFSYFLSIKITQFYLITFQADSTKKLDSREQELSDCKLLIQQHEARIKSVQEAMKELEAKKCMLEMKLDEQNEEVSKLIAKGRMFHTAFKQYCKGSYLRPELWP